MKIRNVLFAAGIAGVLLAAAVASRTSVTEPKPLKVGVVDGQKLLNEYDATKEAQRQINVEGEKWKTKMQALDIEYKEMMNDLTKNKTFLEEAEARRRQREVDDKLRDLQETQTNAEEAIVKLRNQLLEPILATTEQAIKKFGETHDFDMLYEKRTALLYHKPEFDVTALIVQMMNDELKAAAPTKTPEGSESSEGAESSEGSEGSDDSAVSPETPSESAEAVPEKKQ